MSDQTKKIVVPPFLLRRLEAFRIVQGEEHSYVLRDKIQGKTYDFDLWQFFILEVMQGCETVEKLQSVFQDRFDRTITKEELDELFGSVADRKLFDETAAGHPLLAPFMRQTFDVEDGKAKPRKFTATEATTKASTPSPASGAPATAPTTPTNGSPAPSQPEELPAGVQDALGMDWRTAEHMLGLFDPRPLLRILAPVLRPLRHVIYAVPLLVLAALFIAFGYSDVLFTDLENVKLDVSLFEHLLFVFVTVHIVTTLTAAVVADAFNVSVDKVGIYLTFGFMPRWVLKMTGAERLTRNQTMWLHGSTLLAAW
jgi:putative peptide zinc metalloprotease protein